MTLLPSYPSKQHSPNSSLLPRGLSSPFSSYSMENPAGPGPSHVPVLAAAAVVAAAAAQPLATSSGPKPSVCAGLPSGRHYP